MRELVSGFCISLKKREWTYKCMQLIYFKQISQYFFKQIKKQRKTIWLLNKYCFCRRSTLVRVFDDTLQKKQFSS